MKEFFEETKLIRAYDVDFKNCLKINSTFNFLQDTASVHADQLKVGYQDLIELDLTWVLSWAKLEINEYPKFGDEIKIKTWPKSRYKFYSLRDFVFYDGNNQIICNATTAWLPINIKSKRITDLKKISIEIPYQHDVHAIEEYPGKINHETAGEILFTKKVKYSDIDLNQHLNNSKYIELVLDCYSKEHHQDSSIESLAATFISESTYDDELEIRFASKSSENNFDIIGIFNINKSKNVFQALVKWA